MGNGLIRRCCVCKAAIIDGVLKPEGDYTLQKGSQVSDGILSKKCAEGFYGKETTRNIEFDFESCISGAV